MAGHGPEDGRTKWRGAHDFYSIYMFARNTCHPTGWSRLPNIGSSHRRRGHGHPPSHVTHSIGERDDTAEIEKREQRE